MNQTVIRSVAVTTADVVAALETNETTSKQAVLRVLPPFNGRMRARLHLVSDRAADSDRPEEALYLDPETLAPGAPAYPRPSETAAELRANPEEPYSVERHHEYHAEAVAQWRKAVAEQITETVTVESSTGDHEIRVRPLYKEF